MTNKQLAAHLGLIAHSLAEAISYAQGGLEDLVTDYVPEEQRKDIPRYVIETYVGNNIFPILDKNPENRVTVLGRFYLLDPAQSLLETLNEQIEVLMKEPDEENKNV